MLKVNLGCGYVQPEDWLNVDIKDYGSNIMADVRDRLPLDDETVDFVLMNHTLQCFHYDELPVVLKEVRRIMKPGSTLRILTPDLDRAIAMYTTGDSSYFPISDELEPELSGKFARYLLWHGDTRCVFNYDSLLSLLERNGFREIIEQFNGRSTNPIFTELDSREMESLVADCVK